MIVAAVYLKEPLQEKSSWHFSGFIGLLTLHAQAAGSTDGKRAEIFQEI